MLLGLTLGVIVYRLFAGIHFHPGNLAAAVVGFVNRGIDYLIYGIDGKKYLSRVAIGLGLPWDFCLELMGKLEKDNEIGRIDIGEGNKRKTSKKKSS